MWLPTSQVGICTRLFFRLGWELLSGLALGLGADRDGPNGVLLPPIPSEISSSSLGLYTLSSSPLYFTDVQPSSAFLDGLTLRFTAVIRASH